MPFEIIFAGWSEVVVKAGEVLCIPANMPHEAWALEDTLDLDVFTPPRARLAQQNRRIFTLRQEILRQYSSVVSLRAKCINSLHVHDAFTWRVGIALMSILIGGAFSSPTCGCAGLPNM